jgi:uncharacterized FlgJ-related protein
MSTLKKLSEAVKAEARKAGKLPKAPKKPKQSATLKTLEAYVTRHNAYVDKVQAMAAKYRKASALKKTVFGG